MKWDTFISATVKVNDCLFLYIFFLFLSMLFINLGFINLGFFLSLLFIKKNSALFSDSVDQM